MEKGYIYVGGYFDYKGHFILKVGTTSRSIKERQSELNRSYKKAKHNPSKSEFEIYWSKKVSKYEALRYEDRAKKELSKIYKHIQHDRFDTIEKPKTIQIKIRKVYEVGLWPHLIHYN